MGSPLDLKPVFRLEFAHQPSEASSLLTAEQPLESCGPTLHTKSLSMLPICLFPQETPTHKVSTEQNDLPDENMLSKDVVHLHHISNGE